MPRKDVSNNMLQLFAVLIFGGFLFLLFVIALAFFLTVHRRREWAFAMKNQLYTGTPTSRRFVLLPTTVKAGDALLIGTEPCFALDDYQANSGGATCLFNGTFNTTVLGETSASPHTVAAIKPGAKLYASGTLDTATNVTHDLTIDANSSNTPFGNLDPSSAGVGSGLTVIAGVQINAA